MENVAVIIKRQLGGIIAGAALGVLLTLLYAWILSRAWVDESGMALVTSFIRVLACALSGVIAAFGPARLRSIRGAVAGLMCAAALSCVFLAVSGEAAMVRELAVNCASGLLAGLLVGILAEIIA